MIVIIVLIVLACVTIYGVIDMLRQIKKLD